MTGQIRPVAFRLAVVAVLVVLSALVFGRPGLSVEPQPFQSSPFLRLETGRHMASIGRLSLSADGLLVRTISDDQTMRVWSALDGAPVALVRGAAGPADEGALYALAEGPRLLAVAGRTGWDWQPGTSVVRLLDRTNHSPKGVLSGLPAPVSSLAFSADGRFLAVGLFGTGIGIRLYGLDAGRLVLSDTGFEGEAVDLHFLADGRLLALDSGGWLKVYDPDGAVVLGRVEIGRGSEPWRIVPAPDRRRLAVTFRTRPALAILDIQEASAPRYLDLKESGVRGGLAHAAWSPDGAHLFALDDPRGVEAAGELRLEQRLHRWTMPAGHYAGAQNLASLGPELPVMALGTGRSSPADILYASATGSWGALHLGSDGSLASSFVVRSSIPDFRGMDGAVRVEDGGAALEFQLNGPAGARWRFDSAVGRLEQVNPGAAGAMVRQPVRSASGKILQIEGDSGAAQLGQTRLRLEPKERALSAAAVPGGEAVFLGSNFYLRALAGAGQEWRQPIPAPAWALATDPAGRVLVAWLGNGMVQWRASNDGRLLRTLAVTRDGAHWVMWTPEGYFDHSPADGHGRSGAEMIGYQINDGYRREAQFVAADQLYRQYYRPDLVRAALLSRPGDEAILSQALDRTGSAGERLQGSRPPLLYVSEICGVDEFDRAAGCGAPSGGDVTAADVSVRALRAVLPEVVAGARQVELILHVENHTGGIGPIEIRRNGIVVASEEIERNEQERHTAIRQRVALAPGLNDLAIRAFDSSGELGSPEIRLRLEAGFAPSDTARTLRILAVGVADYAIDSFDLQANVASNDARGMVEGLSRSARPGGLYDEIDAVILTDADATGARILEALRALADRARPQDTVLLFLAGHGDVVDGNYYFAPHDMGVASVDTLPKVLEARSFAEAAVRELFRREGVGQAALMDILAHVQSERTIIVLDTCYAGAFGTLDPAQRADSANAVVDRVVRASGRFVLASARGLANDNDGKDYPPGQGHGLFTSVALEALDGPGDRDGDGLLTLAELGGYVHAEVLRLSRDRPVPQVPVARFSGNPYFALADLRPEPVASTGTAR